METGDQITQYGGDASQDGFGLKNGLVISVVLLLGGKPWLFWLGGFLYLAWAIVGYTVDYVREIHWRTPILWPVAGPYLLLYLATIMFYWWPLGLLSRPLWYVYAVLFAISTTLNLTSHQRQEEPGGREVK